MLSQAKRGSALITALFIMTLVAITATAISTRLQLDIYRVRLTQNSDRLYLASQAVTFWAMDRLADPKQDLINLDQNAKILDFPKKLKSIYPQVITQGSLYDLQAKFNLNNLSDRAFFPAFLGLLEQVLPHIDPQERKSILDATINWINGATGKNDAHDEWLDRYLKQRPIYLPGYQFMQHVSEFRTVLGINAQRYAVLLPYLTALPEATGINLNTAPLALLRSLGDGVSKHDAEEIIKLRNKKEIKNLSELGPLIEKLNIPKNEITLESNYFLATAITSIDDMTLVHYAVLKRSKNKQGKLSISIMSEGINTN